jgi:hypothetical protein
MGIGDLVVPPLAAQRFSDAIFEAKDRVQSMLLSAQVRVMGLVGLLGAKLLR